MIFSFLPGTCNDILTWFHQLIMGKYHVWQCEIIIQCKSNHLELFVKTNKCLFSLFMLKLTKKKFPFMFWTYAVLLNQKPGFADWILPTQIAASPSNDLASNKRKLQKISDSPTLLKANHSNMKRKKEKSNPKCDKHILTLNQQIILIYTVKQTT